MLNNAVLVVVDLQIGFLNENSKAVLPAVTTLVEFCTRHGIPSIFTKFVNQPNSPYERLIGWKAVREAPETDLHRSISDRPGVVIEKHFYSACTSEFDDLVRINNWRNILICGVSTESCVLKTAVDTFESGLRPTVIREACASDLGNGMHQKGLEIMEVLIGKKQITTLESFLNS